ncbi:hypothetical protein FSARC_385 [Fusarium sarcochroum]|uniref:Uncharacterized protein n=1 Tax=Fusarium sarcochroum TaxID=1208366 RepID=A0A8H4XG87_9HYPO|nr:hypothetical protein FSARC_385 [Fusarium sarcochroum]
MSTPNDSQPDRAPSYAEGPFSNQPNTSQPNTGSEKDPGSSNYYSGAQQQPQVPPQQPGKSNGHSGALKGAAVGGIGSVLMGGTGVFGTIGGAIVGHQLDKKR